MFFHMAEYCDTLQSKEKRNREHKACLNERAIVRLLDHNVTWKLWCFPALERGDFTKNSGVLQLSLTSTISSGLNSFFPLSEGYLCTPPVL